MTTFLSANFQKDVISKLYQVENSKTGGQSVVDVDEVAHHEPQDCVIVIALTGHSFI